MKQAMHGRPRGGSMRTGWVHALTGALALFAFALPALAESGRELWSRQSGKATASLAGSGKGEIRPLRSQGLSLDRSGLASLLAGAPMERTAAGRQRPLIVDLPDPKGGFQRFALVESPVMEAALAAKHPEIKTYAGRGVDDPTASVRADLSPLGFHASVRSARGSWYIDPSSHKNQGLYLSYYRGDLKENVHGAFSDSIERDGGAPALSTNRPRHLTGADVTLHGSGFAPHAAVRITITSPEGSERSLDAAADAQGSFELEFAAADGSLGAYDVAAEAGDDEARAIYDVVGDETDLDPTGDDTRRLYRLALITDPGYATYFGGPDNVTAAKVALINRVNQLYESDLSVHLELVANNDLLNLDTWALATAPNGPCGTAACFTQSQVTGCSSTTRARFVIGQIIGASNYDIGHLALGQPGGGVANLGVIGRSNKAGGCTGIPTPVGDFYAIDYVAHEMGHQFSGNHTFNGNQLNCSGGNRSAANSVEPGSGSSIMAYAGICLTDDLQPHSDPYFSQRSQQEIITYLSSNQADINEVQTASLRHFGGGNEVQVATFGPGFAPSSTIQPLSVNINAIPSATSRGGAEQDGTTVTIATAASHTLKVGDVVTIAGVAEAGYNGTFTVTTVPASRAFTYENVVTGLANSGGGTVTLAVPGASESGTTVTISTAAAHGRSVGEWVTIAGVGVAGYNGTFAITAVPTTRTFQYSNAASGLANSGGGTATLFSGFQVRYNGVDSAPVGGSSSLTYSTANLQTAIAGIPGLPSAPTVSGASATGFTVTFADGIDVPQNLEIVNLSCGGCFASVEETNHGGAFDSFTINYNGADSAPISTGLGNYTSAGVKAAIEGIAGWPAGGTVTVANFGGGGSPSSNGFQVTFGGTLAATNQPLLSLTNMSAAATGFFGETDKGGPVDNKGGPGSGLTDNNKPIVAAPLQTVIPMRTPFYLTGSAVDPDGDSLLYSWEQNDRGNAGTSLLNNVKLNGALFSMFPKSAPISEADTLLYESPNENHLTTDPTRVFPDLQQILDNNTNADTGSCPVDADIAPPVPIPTRECFEEFLPTTDYVGFSTTGFNNASPLSLHFRFTARDSHGGVAAAVPDTTVLLAAAAGPFRVTAPDSNVTWAGGSTRTVTWDVNQTNVDPVNATQVTIRLSLDGGQTYPQVLALDTDNDGSADVALPNVNSTEARIMVDATSNGFFDISNSNFTIEADTTAPTVTLTRPNGGEKLFSGVPYVVTWTASDDAGVSFFDVFVSFNGGSTYSPTPVCDDVPGTETSCLATITVASNQTNVKLRVTATDGGGNSASDASNAKFSVNLGTPTITVNKPNAAGLAWQAGTVKAIGFAHNLGANAPVSIELDRNYPSGTWETIAASTPTTGNASSTFNWTVTSPVTVGATARIRVTALAVPASDTSDIPFSITSRVKVAAPNTAVKWKVGTTKVVKFNHTYATPHDFAITLDRDGDGLCEELIASPVTAAAAAGTYNWVVSAPAGATNRICVTSTSDPAGTDISDVAFTIQP